MFADDTGRITYGELKDKVERCAEFLRRIGIKRGDVVTIQLPNRIDFPIVFFALELIGAIANKVNPDFRARELEYILKFSDSRALVCPREFKNFDYVGMAKGLRQAVPGLAHVIVAGGEAEGTLDLDQGLRDCPPIAAEHRVRMDPDEIFRMAFTSGTTGDPKCVLHSFNTTLYAGYLLNADMKVTENDVMLIYLPIGLELGLLHALADRHGGRPRCAARAVLGARRARTDPEGARHLHRHRAGLDRRDPQRSRARRFDTSSLRVVITGGASAAIETIRDFQARMNGHLIELYGMLETGFHTYTRFTDDPQKVNGTIGRIVGEMELRIIDDAGDDVPSRRDRRDRGARPVGASRLSQQPVGQRRRPSLRAAGSAPAISAATSMRRTTSRSPAAARRSSTAAARSSSRARSRKSSTPTRRSCTPRWSASPTSGWASATACAWCRSRSRRSRSTKS